MIKIAPSILSADFCRLGADVAEVEAAGADWLHVDVMDGLFVPNISIGLPVLKSLRKATGMFLDAHLMIDRPVRYVQRFCENGADLVNIHVEADTEENTRRALAIIKEQGKLAGVTIKPNTPAEAILPFLENLDLVLVMTVEPGFGGQKFMADMMPKLKTLRRWLDGKNPGCELEVDGGVNAETARICRENGANVLVAGSAWFKAPDPAAFAAAVKA